MAAGTRAARPEPEPCAGQRLGAQVIGKFQIIINNLHGFIKVAG